MFEIITIQMHKLVKIPGIVNRQPWNRLNSYAAQCFLSSAETIYGIQIMSWRYSVYPGEASMLDESARDHFDI